MQGYPIGNSRVRLSWGRSQNNSGVGTPYRPAPPPLTTGPLDLLDPPVLAVLLVVLALAAMDKALLLVAWVLRFVLAHS
ncbi:hypothetical protein PG996_000916 [Apiospora saccharicola]|uniref:Uncharacterized protein n=1 Tax=Apiospora saccharicola TaxID=335842 RepID=A0ABR1WF49_9PEZI